MTVDLARKERVPALQAPATNARDCAASTYGELGGRTSLIVIRAKVVSVATANRVCLSFAQATLALEAESFFVALVVCLWAYGGWREDRPLPGAAATSAALATAVWNQALICAPWPSPVQPLPALASLILCVLTTLAASLAFRRNEAKLAVIAGGAIFGAGGAFSQAAAQIALGAATDRFDDIGFYLAVTVSSATATASLLIYSQRRNSLRARRLAAFVLALGLLCSGMLTRASLRGSSLWDAIDAPLALAAATVVLVAVARKGALPALRRATSARDARKNRPPSPARRRAGTASLRRAPGRSAAARAAGPGHPAPRGR